MVQKPYAIYFEVIVEAMNSKINVLFICLGNICRSPAAEGAFRSLVEKKGMSDLFHIDSCGTSNYHIGSLPDHRTRKVAQSRGINLSHKARELRNEDFDFFDFLLTMDNSNLKNVMSRCPESQLSKIRPFSSFFSELSPEVPDPYYGDIKDFELVQDLVEKCSISFLESNELKTRIVKVKAL